ncbi:MAG: DEAD/DEAH box helicase [Roseibium sp.]|nr:DEAD/DEAH box helicase [Roseibium sp.]
MARYLNGLVQSEEAVGEDDGVLLPQRSVAALSSAVAEAAGIPPLTNLSITLSFDGIMTDPRAYIRVRWYDPDTRWTRIKRSGALISWGDNKEGRLSEALFDLAEAVEAYNATEGHDAETRISAWAPVQNALKRTTGSELKTDDSYLTSLTIYQAGAVALDVFETSYGPDFLPVVMGREKASSQDDDLPPPSFEDEDGGDQTQRDLISDALLPPELQSRFAKELFAGEDHSRDAYVLDRNVFLVVEPNLKTALDVIRIKRSTPKPERIEFLKNPRIAFADALGDDTGDLASALLVETWQYSERVLGLGIWESPAMPWLKNQSGQWLPERFPLKVGEEVIDVDERVFDDLKQKLILAQEQDLPEIQVENKTLLRSDLEDAFRSLGVDPENLQSGLTETEETTPTEDPDQDNFDETGNGLPTVEDQQRLIIHQNLEGQEFEVSYQNRPVEISPDFPDRSMVTSRPKPHQTEGFDWLISCYASGWPGCLLADDMGLGKTFQTLAFLAWNKVNRHSLGQDVGAHNKPILIVAPTALLRNWIDETETHLADDVLGSRLDAFGSALRHLKMPKDQHWSEEDALDVARIRSADWVLTTYETLANYHRAFARVSFSVVVFDEAQKIKSPGAINTQSAKAMNAEFVLALTGTPIENRLADLWCIMDRVVPGYLGDLKGFVQRYENSDPENLKTLKTKLDASPQASTPPVLLRRMKAEILEGLPEKREEKTRVAMPEAQSEAYLEAVVRARSGGSSQGDMLRAIHAFRGISLHPTGADGFDPLDKRSVTDWVSQSARMQHTVDVLKRLRDVGEKALVFVEDIEIQKAFAAAIANLLDLETQPAVINGSVPGDKRLAIVDRFQQSEDPFDLLVLSPKAAGIGLTITAANHVIHLSRWWNPAVEDQCNDRCYRIGQDKPVTVHVPIAVHPAFGETSFDMKMDALLDRKRLLSREMLMPPVDKGDVEALFTQTLGGVSTQGSPASAR